MTVGEPGDKYEQEADWMANQVMRMVVPYKLNAPSVQPIQDSLQRKCAACEEEEDKVQTKPSLQPATDGGLQAGDNIESRLNSSKGGGSSLPDEVRSFMEPRFGADFSSVRVHTDSQAVQMNRELGAQSFTHGSDVYFGAGKSPGNDELMAHELTHVVQQIKGTQVKKSLNQPNAQLECSECELNKEMLQEEPGIQRQATESLIIQRATDDPSLQAGIYISKLLGGNPYATALVNCLLRISPTLGLFTLYRIIRIFTAPPENQLRLFNELMMSDFPLLAHGTTICNCIPPHWIADYARQVLAPYPDAVANFDHYLTGGGAPFDNNVAKMFREDAGVKSKMESLLANTTETEGKLDDPIKQFDYTTKNWLYALGGIDTFFFKIYDDNSARQKNTDVNDGTALVDLELRDPYEWHPDERRADPCLHTGMELMKASGAQDFLVIGANVVRLKLPAKKIPKL
ncbi:DUF4157 domain-containing protein [Desmonostoc muscorum CCALA 125]|nr:DUF4157 domain-containing protein [Desmonostoc muscorum CCALA 125]